jgi:hypothetical protein
MVQGKIVHFIHEVEDGFFLLAAGDYSKSIQLEHTHRKEKVFKIDRNFEPEIMKAYDFDVETKKNRDGSVQYFFRLLSMRDDEFIYDYFSHIEKKVDQQVEVKDFFFQPRMSYTYFDIEHSQFIYTQMRAFSVGWPYVAFS